MTARLRTLGVILAVFGIVFVAAGAFSLYKVQQGMTSLSSFSAAQGVELSYNDEGQLVDRGEVAGAQAIMTLLTDEWGYPVQSSELDPNDPLVNTGTEYMYQMATVAFHTLNSTQTIVLTEDVEYNGEVFEAGTYEFDVDGKYWTDFDREHPIEGIAREQAWSGTAHGLIGELGVGTVTAQALTMGMALSGILAGVGLTIILLGLGLVWVGKGRDQGVAGGAHEEVREPVTV